MAVFQTAREVQRWCQLFTSGFSTQEHAGAAVSLVQSRITIAKFKSDKDRWPELVENGPLPMMQKEITKIEECMKKLGN